MQQHAVAALYAPLGELTRGSPDAGGKLSPGPRPVTPDQCRSIRKPSRCLQEKMREVAGWDQRTASRIDT